MRFVRLVIAFAAAAVAGFASPAGAQTVMRAGIASPAQQPERRAPIGIATINPFLIIIGGFAGDVEVSFTNGFTGALGGTWFNEDNTEYSSFDGTVRYYPGERQPQGFSVGMSLGYLSEQDEDFDPTTGPDDTKGMTLGFIGGYNWLLGRSQRLAIATGVGLKRVFADKDKYPDAIEVAPSGRLNIGISF